MVGEHSSGGSIDSRTSYIGNEIVWGARSTLISVANFSRLSHRFIHSSVTPCPNTEGYLASFTQEEIDRFERVTNL